MLKFSISLRSLLVRSAALAVWLSPVAQGAPTSNLRPNVLFCLADDWSFPHAGVYGDKVVKTPNFDRIAREGALFTHAFCAAPSCTPSRAAILTGQAPHRLEAGGNLWGLLPKKFAVYPELLEAAGYSVGVQGKGWGPGDFKAGERARNPAGPGFKSFAEFLKGVPSGTPFCFWFGSQDPHRPYEKGAGLKSGKKLEDVVVPPWLPDTPEIRGDILDYYFEVERFDSDIGALLKQLEVTGQLSNTLVVVTGDDGMPFPRAKANVYDAGTREPLAIRWPGRIKAGQTIDAFVNLTDLAPTFLEAAGLKPLPDMTGKSLIGLVTGMDSGGQRTKTFVERERHANVRKGDLGYPARAIRTREYLYIRNFHPDRWPAGDPEMWKVVGPYGDCDDSPSKQFLLENRNVVTMKKIFELAFARRPAEELYELRGDPHQINNVAGQPEHAAAQKKLRAELEEWMKQTKDPRAEGGGDQFDTYPYFGDVRKMPARGLF